MSNEITIKAIAKSDCTGCGACFNMCPVDAISMKENEEGFLYPQIDENKCVSCGLCLRTCPVKDEPELLNDKPDVYAAQANDNIRRASSSGGLFSVLAEKILAEGGAVCGAAFDNDYRKVRHILVEDNKGLELLRGSKYVQSATEDVYKQIKEKLNRGQKVLFSGTPCQVAGVRKYIGDDTNLYTIDVLCHGAPSPKSFELFLDTVVLKHSENKKLVELSFRDKTKYGWAPSLYAKTENGYEYSKSKTETPWYNAFLNILNCRQSCGNCKFNKIPRPGDITLGDYWAINELPREWDDGKGTSIVCINSSKGKELFDLIREDIKVIESSIDSAKKKNGNLVTTSTSHMARGRFFQFMSNGKDFEKSTEYALKRKFDIGYVGWWYGKNYGSVLTNFALWKYLTDNHYSVLMLEWPINPGEEKNPVPDTFSRRFANKYYEISMRRTYSELYNFNWFCDSFIVGSDQLWNYWSTRDNGAYFFLDFVEDTKKKIAYSTSFGHPSYDAPKYLLKETGYHLSRFDAVSVREKDGIDICRDTFGVDAEQTIDPVFINDVSVYEELCNEIKIDKSNYIFAYILSPNEEKRETLLKLAKQLNKEVVLILDADGDREGNKKIMNMPESLVEDPELEEWLAYLKNADYVYTDSFHGLCFSIIFHKQFACIANIRRGLSRFKTIADVTNLNNRIVLSPEQIINNNIYGNEIDYDNVDELLKSEIERSKKWLNDALEKDKPHVGSAYDLLVDRIRVLENKIDKIANRHYELIEKN